MRTLELRAGEGRIAMTAYLPDSPTLSGCVIFASPGGGYSRGYYDMRFAGHEGYSQAEHHTDHGHVVVAYDHLGVGDSEIGDLSALTVEEIARVNHQAVRETQARIETGELCADLPAMPNAFHVGIGQSMGGCVSIVMQAQHGSFDAIGVLGYSAIHTVLPQRTAAETEAAKGNYAYARTTSPAELSVARSSAGVSDFVYPFHWDDVPAEILAADMEGGYPLRRTAPSFGSLTIPSCAVAMMGQGFVEADVRSVAAPVFLAFGVRDVSVQPRDEPRAYGASGDITVLVVPRMAHMHNFASTRQRLWDRLSAWVSDQARSARLARKDS